MSTMPSLVDDVRGFNRFYTRVLGLLRPDLAGSAFGLTEARVLFELAHRDDVGVSELRRDLDLDAGYLSRILSGFTASGMAAREKSAADGRRQVVRLTDEGRRRFGELRRFQGDAIDHLLATAAVRVVVVEPSARGSGVGTRLVEACVRFAKRAGYRRMTLWTNDVLVAARRICERAAFRSDRREPHHSFGHDLVGEYWSRDL